MRRWILAGMLGIVMTFFHMLTAFAGGSSWKEDKYGWWLQLEDGSYPVERWMLIDDRWYYFDRNGYAVTGWQRVDGNYYYFKESSCAMVQGWHYDEDEEEYYYLNRESGRHTGWLFDNGAWYWFNSRGRMANEGYTMAQMNQYYFFENGQMAANQYVGLKYYNEDGQPTNDNNIVRLGSGSVTKENRDAITKALKDVPREWIRDFVDQGWQLMYYTEKEYFNAPNTEDGVYYVYHKMDEHYKKLKFTRPEALTQAFGEYVGYRLGLYDNEDESLVAGIVVECENISGFAAPPSYFDEKEEMLFGLAFKAFIDPDNQEEFQEESPEMYWFLEEMIYPSGRPRTMRAEVDPFSDDEEDMEEE